MSNKTVNILVFFFGFIIFVTIIVGSVKIVNNNMLENEKTQLMINKYHKEELKKFINANTKTTCANYCCIKAIGLDIQSTSAPSNPIKGMLWYDTTNDILKIRNISNTLWNTLHPNSNKRYKGG